MSYRIGGIDVHKRMLAVVIADVAVDGEYQFLRRQVVRSEPHHSFASTGALSQNRRARNRRRCQSKRDAADGGGDRPSIVVRAVDGSSSPAARESRAGANRNRVGFSQIKERLARRLRKSVPKFRDKNETPGGSLKWPRLPFHQRSLNVTTEDIQVLASEHGVLHMDKSRTTAP